MNAAAIDVQDDIVTVELISVNHNQYFLFGFKKDKGHSLPLISPISIFRSLLLALLVGDGAGSFASGLAGRLAFATAAFDRSLFQIRLVDGFDMFHDFYLLIDLPKMLSAPSGVC